MAYAYLAGVPPIYGLYSALIPLIVYALFATSRHLSIGPVAVSAILVAAGISKLADPGSEEYISLVITAGLFIGIFQWLLGTLRLGFFVNFLSNPVISGFTSAAAIIIGISQLKDALGIEIPRFDKPVETFYYAMTHILETKWIPLSMCIGGMILIKLLKKLHAAIPGPLIVVIIATALSYFLRLDQSGLEVLGDVPDGLPGFIMPDLSWENIQRLIPTIFTVGIIGCVECLSIAKVLEAKHKSYEINPDKELQAVGLSKIAGAFFQSIPTSGSFSRSAVNSDTGAKTSIAGLITVVIVALALIVLTPLFYYLPKAILASIILIAIIGLFNYQEAIYLWKVHRSDLAMMSVTFVATLILGIELGVLFGVVLSIAAIIYKSTRPHMAILGNIPGTSHYRNVNRYHRTEQLNNALIIRVDEQLYFGNCQYVKDRIKEFVKDSEDPIEHVLLDAGNIHSIDSSGLDVIRDLDRQLSDQGIDLYICKAIGPVRDILAKSGLMTEPEKHHLSVHDAVLFINKKKIDEEHDNQRATEAMQANKRSKKRPSK